MYPAPYPQQPYPSPNPYLDQINQYLMYALKFTPEELALNRTGVMSQAQQVRFGEFMRGQSTAVLKIAAVVLVIFVGVIAVFWFSGGLRESFAELSNSNMTWVLLIPAGALLFWGAMVVFAAVRTRRVGAGSHRLFVVRGAAKVKAFTAHRENAFVLTLAGQPTRYFRVRIGRSDFYVDEAAVQSFVDGQHYIVYAIGSRRAGIIISAEAV